MYSLYMKYLLEHGAQFVSAAPSAFDIQMKQIIIIQTRLKECTNKIGLYDTTFCCTFILFTLLWHAGILDFFLLYYYLENWMADILW